MGTSASCDSQLEDVFGQAIIRQWSGAAVVPSDNKGYLKAGNFLVLRGQFRDIFDLFHIVSMTGSSVKPRSKQWQFLGIKIQQAKLVLRPSPTHPDLTLTHIFD